MTRSRYPSQNGLAEGSQTSKWERRKETTLSELAHARNTDPETSHEAAASVKPLWSARGAVLRMFVLFGPMCDKKLIERYGHGQDLLTPRQSDSGIRSRRAELVRSGYLIDTGYRERLDTGRLSIVWGLPHK